MPLTEKNLELPAYYINKKTGNKYFAIGTVTNSTNAQNGQIMVQYSRGDCQEDLFNNNEEIYVREISEFVEKFILSAENE